MISWVNNNSCVWYSTSHSYNSVIHSYTYRFSTPYPPPQVNNGLPLLPLSCSRTALAQIPLFSPFFRIAVSPVIAPTTLSPSPVFGVGAL
ncbi:hypothetical protein DACRYDRAFT_25212 [Dacryopinax primogenitus]|uniref:Uncharacterized protein n=1 Tax=Dacryopinax primogenitus (strain DJM 731) TaxID=1858805 RepID=M5FPH3_DACPD|nr:uncharacterized protein DACRYDRAFT_25212 [Dacryopinax primogenitus]EJT97078.1 hypothetical protein DACRYDRAFT_25212 [Dacryopinax primogenitus]